MRAPTLEDVDRLTEGVRTMATEAMRADDTVLTVKEVASQLKMHQSVIRRLIYAGRLQAFYVGGRRLRITQRHLEQFLQTDVRAT